MFEKHFEALEEGAIEEQSVITQINCFCFALESLPCLFTVLGGRQNEGARASCQQWPPGELFCAPESHLNTRQADCSFCKGSQMGCTFWKAQCPYPRGQNGGSLQEKMAPQLCGALVSTIPSHHSLWEELITERGRAISIWIGSLTARLPKPGRADGTQAVTEVLGKPEPRMGDPKASSTAWQCKALTSCAMPSATCCRLPFPLPMSSPCCDSLMVWRYQPEWKKPSLTSCCAALCIF